MSALVWLVPIALAMGAVALAAFFWSARNGQYEDMNGAAERIFVDLEDDRPISDRPRESGSAEQNK